MADTIQPPKDKKKRKSEIKRSDLPGAKKSDSNSQDSNEKTGGQKASKTNETAPGLKPVIKAEVDSVEDVAKPKPKPILKPVATVEVEIDSTPSISIKPVATVEVNDEPPTKVKPSLKPVATVEVDIDDEPQTVKVKPILRPVATVELTEEEIKVEEETPTLTVKPVLRPVISVDVDEDEPVAAIIFPPRKGSYVAPKAATKRDVELLYDLDKDKIAELREAFHLFDLNNDGYIDKEDLRNTYVTLGRPEVQDEEIQQMLNEAINPLDFDAFVILLGYKSIELDPEEILLEALGQWDYDNSGLISEERIKHDLMMWGDKFTQEEVEMALEDAPVFFQQDTGNTMIDYVKFCKILCGLRKKPKMPQPGDFMAYK